MLRMNVADLLLLLTVLLFAIRGFVRGLVGELCSLFGFIGGLAAAVGFTPACSGVLESSFSVPKVVALAGTFTLLYAVFSTAAGLAALLFRRPAAGLSKILFEAGGAVAGALKSAAVIGFLFLFIDVFRISASVDALLAGSLLMKPLVSASQAFLKAGTVPLVALPHQPRVY